VAQHVTAWWHWAALFAAGGVGACLRYVLTLRVDAAAGAGAGTLAVNLIGCFAIGVLAGLLPVGTARAIVLVGLLGGLTTYSAFALLTVELGQAGKWGAALGQVGLHVVGGALLCLLGAQVAGWWR
jgi:CrcB protein